MTLILIYAYVQTHQNLPCSHTQSMDVDKGLDHILDFYIALLYTSALAFIRGICTYGINTQISCVDSAQAKLLDSLLGFGDYYLDNQQTHK